MLDASLRSALAATRSLGRAGYAVTVADERPGSLAAASRYALAELTCPSPYRDVDGFLAWAERVLSQGEYDAALPMSEVTTDLLVRHGSRWPGIDLPFPDIGIVDTLSDKIALYRQAVQLGVPVPRSAIVDDRGGMWEAAEEIGFPAVVKPRRSRVRRGGAFESTNVTYIADSDALRAYVDGAASRNFPCLYQQRVEGHGEGIFALYEHGRPVVWFAHRRLREKPPDGGVSVYSESCGVDPELRDMAERLLSTVVCHGPVMVEFKVSEAAGPCLMEINARFWGSLQLAIDAGIDFPRLLFDAGLRASVGRGGHYRTGRRVRWFLGDVDRIYILTRHWRRYGVRYVVEQWARFFLPHPLTTRHEVFRWLDPLPACRELCNYVRELGASRG